MKIKVTSDSTCDLSEELIKEYHITLTPLTVIKNGENFRDGVDISPAEIFAHVDAGGDLCSTSAVNIDEYRALFSEMSAQYDAVIHVNLGSGFSSCYQNATLAAQDFDNVFVVDSQNLSTGQGHIVMEACKRAQECRDLTDVANLCEELRALTNRVETSFLLDRLDYMVKGGRCSMVMALGANLLKLKPCIEVVNGKMQVGKKYRGSYAKCLESYVKERLNGRDDLIEDRLFITHTPVSEKDLTVVKQAVSQYGRFPHVYETTAGCTISCHCGPNTLGVLFIRKK
ncbi:DegV family protein [Zongyangia hominis]|uniref:DegV family protein n=1 Tax=Zongyangia hominis TaxID=2763677 RepID=A0A926IB03_9FIRM|nr:DegV family protein [Zongyangia hominis]MBC8569657.1 DegV family protein [Zongyangia hominis]